MVKKITLTGVRRTTLVDYYALSVADRNMVPLGSVPSSQTRNALVAGGYIAVDEDGVLRLTVKGEEVVMEGEARRSARRDSIVKFFKKTSSISSRDLVLNAVARDLEKALRR